MWPMLVDLSEEECRRALRNLELDAFTAVVSAFRAKGSLTTDRKKILKDLGTQLRITAERYRSEVRRANNDEHLNTIAERLFGPNTSTEWSMEGRRVVPLMHRFAPFTVFTDLADKAAGIQAVRNEDLPPPEKTGSQEEGSETEVMACRKRKMYSSELCESPHKIPALDPQSSLCSPEKGCSTEMEVIHSLDDSMSSETSSIPEDKFPLSSTLVDSQSPTQKIIPQVTTFSNFEQMTATLLSNRASRNCSSTTQEDSSDSSPKPTKDLKGKQRSLSLGSVVTMKSSTIVIPTSISAGSLAKEQATTLPVTTSQTSKLLTQVKSKTSGTTRQNLPAGLGMSKLNSQTPASQKTPASSKSTSVKAKQDNFSIFNKKSSQTVFPVSDTSPGILSPFCEPMIVTKTTVKTDSSLSSANSTKSMMTKNISKTVPSSQHISRSLFSTANKNGAKSASPVIFNVSSSNSPAQPPSKPPTSPQSEGVGKTTPSPIPPKPSPSSAHLKLSSSNAQTIQYRNDGGLVRSARIVNISQPVGSRLPCAITPSAISALGLTGSLSTTALRVTLPPGSLSTTSNLRVSGAPKPNVIVVHKAQMWPRAQTPPAVVVGTTPVSKLPNDTQESVTSAQKQEKPKPSGAKLPSKPIPSGRPQSPTVTSATIKVLEASNSNSSNSSNSSNNAITVQPDSSTPDVISSKPSEKINELTFKKNLAADSTEVCEVVLDNPPDKSSSIEKNNGEKSSTALTNHQDSEVTTCQTTLNSSETSSKETAPNQVQESSATKEHPVSEAPQTESNGMEIEDYDDLDSDIEIVHESNITNALKKYEATNISQPDSKSPLQITNDDDL